MTDTVTEPSAPRRRHPVTALGGSVFALGLVAGVAGWRFGWIEMTVFAVACVLALVLAIGFVLGRSELGIDRELSPERVMAGETAIASLTARNGGRRRTRAVTVRERIDGVPLPVAIPALAVGEDHRVVYRLPTLRRGTIEVGPAVVSRGDPLGLLVRDVAHSPATTLWVHPRWRSVAALPAGFAKDLEGPTSDNAPAGDIAFHAVRPYRHGDDPRHVHWMSTARVGEVMVRHYVDTRRPHLTVVVDGRPAIWRDGEFEVAMEVTASLIGSSMTAHMPVSACVGRDWIVGKLRPADRDRALDRLTTAAPSSDRALLLDVADALRAEPTTSVVAIVTADATEDDLMACIAHARRRCRVVLIDVRTLGADDTPRRALPGARLVAAGHLDAFVTAWERTVRR